MSEAPLRVDWLTFWIVFATAVFFVWSIAAALEMSRRKQRRKPMPDKGEITGGASAAEEKHRPGGVIDVFNKNVEEGGGTTADPGLGGADRRPDLVAQLPDHLLEQVLGVAQVPFHTYIYQTQIELTQDQAAELDMGEEIEVLAASIRWGLPAQPGLVSALEMHSFDEEAPVRVIFQSVWETWSDLQRHLGSDLERATPARVVGRGLPGEAARVPDLPADRSLGVRRAPRCGRRRRAAAPGRVARTAIAAALLRRRDRQRRLRLRRRAARPGRARRRRAGGVTARLTLSPEPAPAMKPLRLSVALTDATGDRSRAAPSPSISRCRP